ncbi:MAG: hypothetical protein ACLPID_01825 [Beijerinckiaceae bacterium]
MPYAIIQPPFTLKFKEMSKQELKGYRQWFLEIIPGRIAELAGAVRSSPGYEAWSPDRSPASLEPLGSWFVEKVETRPRKKEEIDKVKGRSPYDISITGEELTNRTFSLSIDLGMYLGEVLLSQHPNLRWHQPLDDKKFADYGQLVLFGFGRVPMNPVRIAVTLSYSVASGKQTGRRLMELYEYWSQKASESGN